MPLAYNEEERAVHDELLGLRGHTCCLIASYGHSSSLGARFVHSEVTYLFYPRQVRRHLTHVRELSRGTQCARHTCCPEIIGQHTAVGQFEFREPYPHVGALQIAKHDLPFVGSQIGYHLACVQTLGRQQHVHAVFAAFVTHLQQLSLGHICVVSTDLALHHVHFYPGFLPRVKIRLVAHLRVEGGLPFALEVQGVGKNHDTFADIFGLNHMFDQVVRVVGCPLIDTCGSGRVSHVHIVGLGVKILLIGGNVLRQYGKTVLHPQ